MERQECGGDKHRARHLRDADTDARIARVPSGDNDKDTPLSYCWWWAWRRVDSQINTNYPNYILVSNPLLGFMFYVMKHPQKETNE